jgi:predicted amidophosphoribosyltransferase
LILLASALLPLRWLIDKVRARKRVKQGLCVTCGYDLRASTGRCPECGTPIAPPRQVVSPSSSTSSG